MRNNAYLEVSVFIAQYEEYRELLIKHLLEKKIVHWDTSIRELAAIVCIEKYLIFESFNLLKTHILFV